MGKKKILELKKTHNGKFIKTYLAKYQTEKGERLYEIASRKDEPDVISKVRKPDAVRILPYYYDETGTMRVVLIKEFRYAVNGYIYGLPAGLIDNDEDPVESAKRELMEEIGGEVINIEQTEKASYSSAGFCDESLVCFEAEVALTGQQHLERFEDITVLTASLKELENMLDNEEFGLQSRLQLRCFLYKQFFKEASMLKKTGAFVGKFLPPHSGHLSVIDRALKECGKVVVVLSDNPEESKRLCKEANFPYFSSKQRMEWIKEHYKSHKNIEYYIIDESKLKKHPFDMEEYAKLFHEIIKEEVNVKYADESYRQLNEKYFSECEFVPLDRDLIPIHGTDIRLNPTENLKYVVPEGQEEILRRL